MFTPLAYSKNRFTDLEYRADNSSIASSTSAKSGGYRVAADSYWTTKTEGTIVVSAFPNSDDLRYSGTSGNRFKWMFANWEGASSGWFSPCIATENNIQVGSAGDYSLLGASGWKKGQIGVQCRFITTGTADGLILINSGSTYDWNNPTPITIAFTCDVTAQKYSCAINGETAVVVEEARGTGKTPPSPDPDWSGYDFIADMSAHPTLAWSDSPGAFDEILMSGSYYEFSFYETPLTQAEMNYVTSQTWGSPTNVLDTQPEIRYRFTPENKNASDGSFSQIGSDQVSMTNNATRFSANANQLTSGSVWDGSNLDYRTRLP